MDINININIGTACTRPALAAAHTRASPRPVSRHPQQRAGSRGARGHMHITLPHTVFVTAPWAGRLAAVPAWAGSRGPGESGRFFWLGMEGLYYRRSFIAGPGTAYSRTHPNVHPVTSRAPVALARGRAGY